MTSRAVRQRAIPSSGSDRAILRRPASSKLAPNQLILLMQVGWVAVGLITVASFPDLKTAPVAPVPQAEPSVAPEAQPTERPKSSPSLTATSVVADPAILFANGSESIVARTVGHAEGTRAPDGSRTPAYFGHTDPGNGVWNLGSFSFQHCREPRYQCSTPEQADTFQLQRLQAQNVTFRQRAIALGFSATLEEELNGIDLANQAPLAALGRPGYPDYLRQAKKNGLNGQTAILEARLWSFWNPQTKRWDAPGLGNTEASIRHDQQRRMLAIARVLETDYTPVADPSTQQRQNWLNAKLAQVNPYSYQNQHKQYLWWDAGYWDAKLNRGRQLPVGQDADYDQGFRYGSKG